MKNYILEAKKITKKYNNTLILDNISFSLPKGKSMAFMGPNGCGKSTLLRILTGVTVPTSGEVILHNEQVTMSFIPDHYERANFSAKVFFKQMLEMYKPNGSTEKLEKLIADYQIEHMLKTPLKHLSKGSLQKIALIQGLLCDADLLFLDEPLSGQDISSEMLFVNHVNEMKEKGSTIIIACHNQDLIDDIADEVLYLENGKIVDKPSAYNSEEITHWGHFVLTHYCNKEMSDLEKLEIIHSFGKIGHRYKITTLATNSAKIFSYCIDKGIHILQYEEGEKR